MQIVYTSYDIYFCQINDAIGERGEREKGRGGRKERGNRYACSDSL